MRGRIRRILCDGVAVTLFVAVIALWLGVV